MINEYVQFVKVFCSKTCETEECLQLCFSVNGLKYENEGNEL